MIAIGALVALVTWGQTTLMHTLFSTTGTELTGPLLSPQFMPVVIGGSVVSLFSLGILFLAFDIRMRDVQNRIQEAIDIRPVSNIELLTGRLIGIVVLMGLAAILTVLAVVGIALLLHMSKVPFGHAIDPVSLLSFLVWDIVPNLAFVGALIILLAIIVRFRMLVLLIGLVLLGVGSFISFNLPFLLQPAVNSYVFVSITGSDIAPLFLTSDVLLNRLAMLLLSAGFLTAAATIHPRNTARNNRIITGTSAIALLTTGILVFIGLIYSTLEDVRKAENWANIHEQFHAESRTDITKVSGTVEIAPGRQINLNLVLNLDSSTASPSDTWMFSLNPGYRIRTITVDGTNIQDYSFDNGILRVPRTQTTESDVEIEIDARGVPNPHFAYLDASLDWQGLTAPAGQRLTNLGTESYIFHPQYVALVPGVTWLPTSGTAYKKESYEDVPTDFFELDVEVVVPRGWTVVGPGKRIRIEDKKRARFRFNPRIPLPEVALIASKFEMRSMEVEGIDFEILLSPKHSKNLQVLRDAAPALRNWLRERLLDLDANGLNYPFDTYSLVEVPNRLRVYGGGWRMDSVLGAPSILMVREWRFPLARFDNSIRTIDREQMTDADIERQLFSWARSLFERDLQGGNPLLHFSKNLVSYKTRPSGPSSTAINYVVNELADDLWTDEAGYFSMHTYLNFVEFFVAQESSPEQDARRILADRHSVWNQVFSTSLADLDYDADGYKAMHVLNLRGGAVASSVSNAYQKDIIGAFLQLLTDRYLGTTYSKEQFLQTALDVGLDFDHVVGDWMESRAAPGFLASDASVERISDSESGNPVYQTTFFLRNSEPVPGIVWISHQRRTEQISYLGDAISFQIPAETSMRVATQLSEKPNWISIDPGVSLNRKPIELALPTHEILEITESPELPALTEVDWQWPFENEIVIDDLDPGFSIVGDEADMSAVEIPWIVRFFLSDVVGLDEEPELDNGLSDTNSLQTTVWTRNSNGRSFGKYRQTFAVKSNNWDGSKAKFSTSLPNVGRWELRFHVPQANVSSPSLQIQATVGSASMEVSSDREFATEELDGVLSLEVRYGDKTESIQLELKGTSMSWQSLGVFNLDTTEVDVLVLEASKRNAFADAIHWLPVDED